MIAGLKPYPAYKPSGLEWLGEVPAHWEVRRLRNAADMRVSNVDKHAKDQELPVRLCNYVDVYKNDHIKGRMDFMRATATREEIERFRLQEGDVLITKDSETWDDIGVPALVKEAADDLISGYHLALLRPQADQLAGAYLLRALQNRGLAQQFHIEAKGVTRYGLSHASIKSVWLPLPSLPEQTAIARFLDHADRRIRRYIHGKQKLIALLEEQKQAIIHQAVTGQIDVRTGQPYPAYKSSGVEWLGNVPAHWEVVPFKRRVGFQEGPGIMGAEFRESGVPLLRISCLRGQIATLNGCNFLDRDMVNARWSHFKVKEGDYLLSASASTGAVSLATSEVAGSIPYTGIIRLWAISDRTLMAYVQLFMTSRLFQDQIEMAKSGVGIEHFGPTHLKRMVITLPPICEQESIVALFNKAVDPLAGAIASAYRQINFLHEYRTRLIADVVTGKLDVREAAATLPEVDALAAEDNPDDTLAAGIESGFDVEVEAAD